MALLEADAALSGDSDFLGGASVGYSADASLPGSSLTILFLGARYELDSVQSGGALFFTSPAKTTVTNYLRGPQVPVPVVPVEIPPIRVGSPETQRPVYSVNTKPKRRGS